MRASRTRSDSSLITHHSSLITHKYRTVARFGTTTNGAFDRLAQFGGSLMQDHAIGPSDDAGLHAFSPDAIPSSRNDRRASPLFGLGFVDAVPDSDFFALATKEAAR